MAIIRKILKGEIKTREEVDLEKKKLLERFHYPEFIRNSDILRAAKDETEREKILKILQKKPTRTISGVAVVAAMTKPSKCPHGKCAYCPGGPDVGAPQSYTGKEPATRRAIRYSFDPYLQVTFRLHQLREIGHPIDKVELIVMGGTLTAQPLSYQKYFVGECLRAMNDFSENNSQIKKFGSEKFIEKFNAEENPLARRSSSPRGMNCEPIRFASSEMSHPKDEKEKRSLKKIQEQSEHSDVRCIGMTFEPRPDYAKKKQIDNMLSFGVTRVEMGLQLPFDSVYRKINRGHTVRDVSEATQQLKDSGLKVGYHLMPGLIGKNFKKDMEGFKLVFSDERFKPDMIKIYPCLILKGTEYYKNWKAKKFKPLETEDAVKEILELKKILPPWVRTMRIQRDIPSPLIEAGVKASNLGQLVYREMEKRKISCKCIRCREVGRKISQGISLNSERIKLVRRDYKASKGKELFLSFEDVKQDILIGFLRLRIPYKPFREEISERTALVRELHVYGPMVEIGEKLPKGLPARERWQHRGYGHELLDEAEKISIEDFDMKEILVTSGIGARDYYRKFDYERKGVYMGKKLDK